MFVDLVNPAAKPATLPVKNEGPARTRTGARRGPWLQIVTQVLQLAGPRAEFLRHGERPWASATFSGARHTIALSFTGEDALVDGEAFVEALPEHEFAIAGHLVADSTLRGIEHVNGPEPQMSLEIEMLLLEDV
ncbi:hypothetical protein [Novosphingobium profundi]|uniref:hypothetical protein n=1 Tax=Novosphingobium profundi TaxID=1774954 RepID=UPI001FE808AC|nr:hypothetical protein [Novosphingobium profundi]